MNDTAHDHIREKRVLIAEDEGPIRRLLEEICEAAGFSVDAVHEGRAAWALLSSMGEVYSTVFLDVHMPGWSGDDVLSLLSMLSPRRKFIVIVTGYLTADLRENFECHPNVFRILDKPFSTREVSAILHEVILINE